MSPKYFSAQDFSSRRMQAEISGGVKSLSPSRTRITLLLFSSMRNGKRVSFVLNVGNAATHEALYGVDCAVGICEQALAGGFAD